AGALVALAAVAVSGRDRQHHPAADLGADEGLVPARDHPAGADADRRGLLAVSLVERLLGAVHLPEVVDGDRLAALHGRAVTLDQRRGVELAVGLRRPGEVEG